MKCKSCKGKKVIPHKSGNMGIDICPDCNGTGTKPEPGQDEIMRQFEKCWHGVFDHLDEMLLIEITDVFRSGCKSGRTSRNSEIEELKHIIKGCQSALNTNGERFRRMQKTIEALKAEIQSLRCCGNCSHGYSGSYTMNNLSCMGCERGLGIQNNWIPKSKLCKDSTTTIQESPCNH